MAEIAVPERPVLTTIPGVELIKVGRWNISTGVWDVSSDDLYAAAAAAAAPGVRRPILKLGHTDPRFDGEPAIGWVDNLRVDAAGSTLLGDYCGLPGWLADVLASAYPDRSIEGAYGFADQTGREHPFVLTAVALLGVTPPGVGTLGSLQDIAALYGVAASRDDQPAATFAVPVSQKGKPLPDMKTTIHASQTLDELMRSFYAGPGDDNWWWIEEVYVDPAQVVAVDDSTGLLYLVEYTATDTDITWSEPVEVKRDYVAASGQSPVAAFESREQSRPTDTAAAAVTDSQEGNLVLEFTDDQAATLRGLLSLDEDADAAAVIDAVKALADEPAEASVSASALGADQLSAAASERGMVVVDASTFDQVKAQAAAGATAMERLERQEREATVDGAIAAGKIAPSSRSVWLTQLQHDPGAEKVLAAFPDNTIPVVEMGHNGDAVGASTETDAADLAWFGGK